MFNLLKKLFKKNKLDDNGLKHGYWEEYHTYYVTDGKLKYKLYYNHGKKHGYCEAHYSNGVIGYKGNWINDKPYGKFERFHLNGELFFKEYIHLGKDVYKTTKNKYLI